MGSRFASRWILLVTAGEALGFTVAIGAALASIALGWDDARMLILLLPAGAIEGALLATGQYMAMQRERPRPGRWIGFTAAAASVAWLIGMLPSMLGLSLESALSIVLLVLGGVVLLASLPLAQWLAMARPRTFRWVPITMGAWLVAILWTAAPSLFHNESTPVPFIAALYGIAGLLMAVTIAVLTMPLARSLFAHDG